MELKQEQALRNAAKDELQRLEARKDKHLSELASELGSVNAINKRLESELDRARGELLGGETAINNLKFELMEKDRAIATLQTELDNRLAEAAKNEIFLSEELQLFPTPEEQATVTPPPEELSGTSQPEPEHLEEAEPITETTVFEPREATPEEPENDTTEVLQTEVQPKLLNPKQLAEWINKNCNPEKPITDQNVRDWYNPKKTCEEKRLENEQKYGHKLDHKDKKGTLWFTVG
ncbi:hypothetical protein [Planktothrix mougeotii]|uniref:Uncharacterized protein n=1 Tax=Planktothrix mougeotii LEGE 06226 TaxID=1828728 RepID=A0ABR9UFN5_9CYAN|nr:hypothetical protein [Planktothrix mougeotii]MBE9144904.1 hypothetical protein [Planktothrix mougeotii LEGE 06226]